MDQKVREFCIQKAEELKGAPTCCPELKEAAQDWIEAMGTQREAEQTKKMVEELEMDIMPIDNLIAFASSEAGAQLFGAEKAKDVAAHARQIKEGGAKYCDCPACAACEAILEKKEELL